MKIFWCDFSTLDSYVLWQQSIHSLYILPWLHSYLTLEMKYLAKGMHMSIRSPTGYNFNRTFLYFFQCFFDDRLNP